jgi:alpha-mannosidase
VVTLWHGIRRVELRTELHDWTGKDRLVRLRFPTTLAGATPVSSVGDAVVARGFALIDVDSAEAPWTLDNPAAEWFGLSTTLVVETPSGPRPGGAHRRSVGVAEIVTAPGAGAAPWARELVVALVQKGVTATCSEAQRNRYGALLADSNLPDFRIAVGGRADNPFVADVLSSAGPDYTAELEDQVKRQGWGRVLVPAERPLAEVWRPNADLRDPRALPVLVVAGADHAATEAAASSLAAAVATGRVVVEQAPALVARAESVPEWTAAILNRGTPGFAVDSSAALHVSLLRASSGWPSGVWIDPPRRFTPDGAAFELEHWSHVYDHALVFGRGDWRQTGVVEDAQSYNRPLVATLADPHSGPLPSTARLIGISQPSRGKGGRTGQAVLALIKPAGNHLASSEPGPTGDAGENHGVEGDGVEGDGAGRDGVELSLRCYEAEGQPVEIGIESRFRIMEAARADLLEQPGEKLTLAHSGGTGRLNLDLKPGELATVRLRVARQTGGPSATGPSATGPSATGPFPTEPFPTEPAQPVFSRYWLHNKGAAPMGNQALAVHALPTAVVVRAGSDGHFTAQLSSGAAHGTQAGQIELVAPAGWEIDPPSKLYSLAPGAFVRSPVRFRAPDGSRPGRHFLAVRVVDGHGQVQEDVVTVDLLPPLAEADPLNGRHHSGPGADGYLEPVSVLVPPAPFGHPSGQLPAELEATLDVAELTVSPGGSATLGIRLANRTSGELRGEVQLLSPLETWPFVGPWVQGVTLAPGEGRRVEVTVRGPADGWLSSWALFKVTYFGRLFYSPTVLLRLGQSPSATEPASLTTARHG